MKEKSVFLIRHAKAEEGLDGKLDYYRALKEKGIEKACEIAFEIKDKITLNEETMLISSSAKRALQTAEIFCNVWGYPAHKIIKKDNIYEATFTEILKEINKVPNHIDTIILFGHNPGLSSLTNYICNTYINLSTASAAEILLEKNFNFAELSENTAYLKHIFGQY